MLWQSWQSWHSSFRFHGFLPDSTVNVFTWSSVCSHPLMSHWQRQLDEVDSPASGKENQSFFLVDHIYGPSFANNCMVTPARHKDLSNSFNAGESGWNQNYRTVATAKCVDGSELSRLRIAPIYYEACFGFL